MDFRLVYMENDPSIAVQCILAEVPALMINTKTRLKFHFERRFGKVNYVEPLENLIEENSVSSEPSWGACYVMFASPEIASIAMHAGHWMHGNKKLSIIAAGMWKQLELQPEYLHPPIYLPLSRTISQRPIDFAYDHLNAYCLMAIFNRLDFTSVCNFAAADDRMFDFADEYVFCKKTTVEFYPESVASNSCTDTAMATIHELRRDLYFIGPHVLNVTLNALHFADASIHHITSVIEACPKLKSLRLNYFDMSMHDIIRLSRYPCLAESLTLFRCRIRYHQWSQVMAQWPNLVHLIVHNLINEDDMGVKYLVDHCSNLQTLHLFSSRQIAPATVRRVVHRNRKTLRSLKLVEIATHHIDTFDLMLQYPQLEFVSVEVQKLRMPSDLLKLHQFRNLRGVAIRCLPMLNAVPLLKYLVDLKLERLELDYFAVDKPFTDTLARFTTVRSLKLSTVGDVLVQDVVAIVTGLPKLRDFELGTYANCEYRLGLELQHCKQLKRINFRYSTSTFL